MTDVTTLLAGIKERATAAMDYPGHVTVEQSAADVPRLVATLEAVAGLHRPIKIYDECECPEGTHPEEYDYIDCDSYVGCENSLVAIGCEECCSCGDYLTEECGEHHRHSLDPTDRCPTITAVVAALGGGE